MLPYEANPKPVYVTKWALTAGIMKFEAGQGRLCLSDSDPDQVYFSAKWGHCNGIFVRKQDWTYDFEEARERVKVLVQRKLKNLAKQVKKLETFEPKVVEPAQESA